MIAKSARLALHMAEASTTELPRTRTRRQATPLVRWWMIIAGLVLASGLAGVIAASAMTKLLRWGIT